ncbi:MAG TPA: polysaccharide deacetylase family protein [Gammaproteobacteria bacterium]|nr:polysaccharide deacetylase family protein [Gammaproteobacteria bacterium]
MSDWDALEAELDRWARAGNVATFWWRDDDAFEPSPALSMLLELSETHAVPLSLAVIPAKADPTLLDGLPSATKPWLLQHGFAHANHAPWGEKKAEFGAHRSSNAMSEEIVAGAGRLRTLFGQRFLPLFVPPWNRISRGLTPLLPSLGIVGLSTFAPRRSASPAPGLKQANAHADLIDWRGGRRFKGTARAVEEIAVHLSARRNARADPDEPSGILSHHQVHDRDCWQFLEQLFTRTCGRDNVRWLTAAEAFEI